ncbi:MAG: prepilin-type N-terminal cleavage/methylation domain-containing protein [bacterium]|nr:prepilin-type N-terminal cleavage/methylation domain-containing protein [bacterium]
MLNNKGFTLVELLAVLAILVTILLITIPSVTSTIDRTKNKELESKKELIKTSAELYISNNKNFLTTVNICYIPISELTQTNMIKETNIINPFTNQTITGCVVLNQSENQYTFEDECDTTITKCLTS